MPKEPNYLTIIDELINEEGSIMNELIEEEIAPLIKYQKEKENESFDKAYREFKELEEV